MYEGFLQIVISDSTIIRCQSCESCDGISVDTEESGNPAFGLATDPLAQFAVMLSAVFNSTDHPGVSNEVIVSEGSEIERVYQNRSVVNQNAFSLG